MRLGTGTPPPCGVRFPHFGLFSEEGHSLRNQEGTRAHESSPYHQQSSCQNNYCCPRIEGEEPRAVPLEPKPFFPFPFPSLPPHPSLLDEAERCARAHPGWPGKGLQCWPWLLTGRRRSHTEQNIPLQASSAHADIACKTRLAWGCRTGSQRPTEAAHHVDTPPAPKHEALGALSPPASPTEMSREVSSLSHDRIPLKTAENTYADGN